MTTGSHSAIAQKEEKMKKIKVILSFALCALLLFGCSYFNDFADSASAIQYVYNGNEYVQIYYLDGSWHPTCDDKDQGTKCEVEERDLATGDTSKETGYIAKGDINADFIYMEDKYHIIDGWYVNMNADIPDVTAFDPEDVEYIELVDTENEAIKEKLYDRGDIANYIEAVAYSKINKQEEPDGSKLLDGSYFIVAKYKNFDTGVCYLGEYTKTADKYGFGSYFLYDGTDSDYIEKMLEQRAQYLSKISKKESLPC